MELFFKRTVPSGSSGPSIVKGEFFNPSEGSMCNTSNLPLVSRQTFLHSKLAKFSLLFRFKDIFEVMRTGTSPIGPSGESNGPTASVHLSSLCAEMLILFGTVKSLPSKISEDFKCGDTIKRPCICTFPICTFNFKGGYSDCTCPVKDLKDGGSSSR